MRSITALLILASLAGCTDLPASRMDVPAFGFTPGATTPTCPEVGVTRLPDGGVRFECRDPFTRDVRIQDPRLAP